MIRQEVRFDVELISPAALAQYMEHRGETTRSLAIKVGCSHGTIGHLMTGHRKSTKPRWAKAIERHLNAPPGSLFVPRLSTVSRETARKVAA